SLVATGGSAGGLLMGAVANMAPELFAGISAHVPFVDPLTSILMPELPLTVIDWEEWGDTLHDAHVYEYLRSYCPYQNVCDGDLAQRHPGPLRRAREMGGTAARGRCRGPAQDGDGRRARRGLRSL